MGRFAFAHGTLQQDVEQDCHDGGQVASDGKYFLVRREASSPKQTYCITNGCGGVAFTKKVASRDKVVLRRNGEAEE